MIISSFLNKKQKQCKESRVEVFESEITIQNATYNTFSRFDFFLTTKQN